MSNNSEIILDLESSHDDPAAQPQPVNDAPAPNDVLVAQLGTLLRAHTIAQNPVPQHNANPRVQLPKLDTPKFYGKKDENAAIFWNKLIHYQDYYQLSEAQVLSVIPSLLFGDAAIWYNQFEPFTFETLADFRELFHEKFLSTAETKLKLAEFFRLSQTGSVNEYTIKFLAFRPYIDMCEDDLIIKFISGLRDPLYSQLMTNLPIFSTLDSAISSAQINERVSF
jgi:hypothetical protein